MSLYGRSSWSSKYKLDYAQCRRGGVSFVENFESRFVPSNLAPFSSFQMYVCMCLGVDVEVCSNIRVKKRKRELSSQVEIFQYLLKTAAGIIFLREGEEYDRSCFFVLRRRRKTEDTKGAACYRSSPLRLSKRSFKDRETLLSAKSGYSCEGGRFRNFETNFLLEIRSHQRRND